MKKIVTILIMTAFLLTSFTMGVSAKWNTNDHTKEKGISFRISDSPVITYGRFKLPLSPVEKGMGADVSYRNGVITISKGTKVIEIDIYNKKVYVTTNGVKAEDTNSGIFTSGNNKGMTVLIGYIADKLGVKVHVDGDDIVIDKPLIDPPAAIILTAFGGTVVANTLNSTNLYLQVQASITAGQAQGGKAELYIGSKLIATDPSIIVSDTAVTFTTSDATPTAAELQALVPNGGRVTVRLYNAAGEYTASRMELKLTVDYSAPVINSISKAVFYPETKKIKLYITGAIQKNDILDVSKIRITDISPAVSRILTDSKAEVYRYISGNESVIYIKLSAADAAAILNVGGDDASLTLLAGTVIADIAGNPPAVLLAPQTVKLNVVIDD